MFSDRRHVGQVAENRTGYQPPCRRLLNHARNLAKRFHQLGQACFRFITAPGVEPTNNLAEQAIRFVVIDRRITQGTRRQTGCRWCERIWTAIATCTHRL